MKLIYRVTSGLLYGKTIEGPFPNSFVTSDWDTPSSNVSLDIFNSALKVQTNSTWVNPGIVRNNIVSSQSKVLISSKMRQASGVTRIGIAAHVDSNDPASADGVDIDIPANAGSVIALLREWNNGVYTTLDSLDSQNGLAGTLYNFWLFADGTTIVGTDTLTDRDWSGTANVRSSGQVGIWATTHDIIVYVWTFFVSTDRYLTIYGLENGDSIELRDSSGNVLTSSNESGGSAVIDVYGLEVAQCDRVVLIRSSVDYAQYTIGPNIYISGGDEYYLDDNIIIAENTVTANNSRYIEYNSNLYFGSISPYGEIKISEFYPSTSEVTTNSLENVSSGDLHHCPCVLVDSAGYIWVFYSLHNEDTSIYYYKSTNIEDVSSFGTKQTISGFSSNVSYCRAYQRTDGRIILFTRLNVGTNDTWGVAWTDNGGSSWSKRSWLGTSTWMYFISTQYASNANILKCAIHWSTTGASIHDIRMLNIDLSDGNVTIPGGSSIGNIYSGSLVDPSNALQVYTSTVDSYAWCEDINEFGEVFFTTFDPGDPDNTGMYNYVKVNSEGVVGSVKSIVAAGSPTVSSSSYSWGRGNFAGESVICLARENLGSWLIEAYILLNENWYSTQLNKDPDDGVALRRYPITSSIYNKTNSYVIYNRQKSEDNTLFLFSNDLIISEFNISSSNILINESFKPITDIYIHNGIEFKRVIDKYIRTIDGWKKII